MKNFCFISLILAGLAPMAQAESTALYAPALSIAKTVSASGIITEAPEGETLSFARAGGAYYAMMGTVQTEAYEGVSTTVVAGNDGAYYLLNPLSQADTGSYLKLDMENGKLVAHLPQPVLQANVNGKLETFSLYRMNYTTLENDEATYMPDTKTNTITWTLEDGVWQMEGGEQNDMILGMADSKGQWYGYGEFNTSFTPFSDTVLTLPEGLTAQEWSFTYGESGKRAKVAMTDKNVYIGGFCSTFPDAWIKGVVDGSKVTFASGQYLGIEPHQYHYCYFKGATVETVYDETLWRDVDKFTPADNVTFTLSADGKALISDGGMMATTMGKRIILTVENFARPQFRALSEDMSYIPADPVITEYEPYTEDDGMGAFEFTFPVVNVDGIGLDVSKLYYRIYFDEVAHTFSADIYDGLENDMDLLPYGFTDENFDFMAMGATHTIFYYEPAEVVGVQIVYKDGENEYASRIVSTEASSVGDIATDGNDLPARYYDLSGRPIGNPTAPGLYIRLCGNKATKVLVR